MRPIRSTMRFRALAPIVAVALTIGASACGEDDPPSTSRYCGLVRDNAVQLNTPTVGNAADIDATLSLYREIAEAAPLAVEVEWATLVISVETASTVVASDQASVQTAADTARASQRAAEKVQTYTQQVCGVELGTPPTTVAVTVPRSTAG